MDYSTKRGPLILPEYGRNIQRMVEYIKTIEDREIRNQAAQEIINIMGNMNPHLRDINDFKHKLWDQLAQMSNFDMDIDSPYPTPQKETFESRPNRVSYTTGNLKYRYLGRIMQKLIKAAIKIEDKEKRDELVRIITNHMKKLYRNNLLNGLTLNEFVGKKYRCTIASRLQKNFQRMVVCQMVR